jgi:hypothetical protein
LIGGGIGLVYRLAFSGYLLGNRQLPDAMSAAFAIGAPIAMGAVTVLLAERTARRSWGFYFFAPWLSVLLCVGGAALILIEGSICIAMALPLFVLLGSIGGLAAGVAARIFSQPTHTASVFAALPLALAGFNTGEVPPDHYGVVQASVDIMASPAAVWEQLNHASAITASDVGSAWIYSIGVPRPLAGITTQPGAGGVRLSRWEKDVHFRERIMQWRPDEYVSWSYEFDPDSFPAGALDEHVVIGGRYFDLRNSSYRLEPIAGGTRLTLVTHYRVTTGFNWYSDAIARLVLEDFSEAILDMYRRRAQRVAL